MFSVSKWRRHANCLLALRHLVILSSALVPASLNAQNPDPPADPAPPAETPNVFTLGHQTEDKAHFFWDLRLPLDGPFVGPTVTTEKGEPVDSLEFVPRKDLLAAGETLTNIFFVVDTSDAANRIVGIERSKATIRSLLDRNRVQPHQRFGMGVLGERLLTISKLGTPVLEIIQKTENNEFFPPQTKTFLYKCLIEAIEGLPDTPRDRNAIVVFTDGLSEDGGAIASTAADVLAAAKAKNTAIITIALQRLDKYEKEAKALKRFSDATAAPWLLREKSTNYNIGTDVLDRLLTHLDSGGQLKIPVTDFTKGLTASATFTRDNTAYRQELALSPGLNWEPKTPDPADPDMKEGDKPDPDKTGDPEENDNPEKAENDPGNGDKASPDDADSQTKKKPSKSEKKGFLEENLLWIIIGAVVLVTLIAIPLVLGARKRAKEEAQFLGASPSSGPPPAPSSGVFLEQISEPYTTYPLVTSAVRIGRGLDNEVRLENDSVSKHHAEIHRTSDGRYLIQDLSSGNGVFVNGNRVDSCELKPGDVIEFGEVHLKLITR